MYLATWLHLECDGVNEIDIWKIGAFCSTLLPLGFGSSVETSGVF